MVDLDRSDLGFDAFPENERYAVGSVLGAGGMGEVRICTDRRIGRQVAMKKIRSDAPVEPEMRARFFREARVQGQTEHPSIVPVYDVGTDEAGSPYFTMRCVEGQTLEEIVRGLRQNGSGFERLFSQRKLLTAFGSACLAVHFAHTRRIVHCDLKPANIMLGSFGEVYVLDWGLATRVQGKPEAHVYGTPGYAAPEQVRGESPDPRWDVYALGAVLYEILTLEPMLAGDTPKETFEATLRGQIDRPTRKAPARDIAPELEAIWARATTLDADRRYAGARELYDDLERYLEGDRDLVRRRELSREHASRAASLSERAVEGGAAEPSARSEALGAVGRALALDPDNADALRTLVRLLTEPPTTLPPEALEDMHATERGLDRARGRSGFFALLLWAVLAPPAFVRSGIHNVPAFALNTVAGFVGAALGLLRMRRPRRDGTAPSYLPIGVAIVVCVLGSCFNASVLTPTLAVAFGVGYTLSMDRRRRFLPMIAGSLALAIPTVLELTGVLPTSTTIRDGQWCMAPRMAGYPGPNNLVPALFDIVCLVAACLYSVSFREVLTDMERRAAVGAWQLRQLVPKEARSAARPEGREQ
jgi:serine/threonine protein kinase